MEFETIKKYLEKPTKDGEPTKIHELPLRFFDPFIIHGVHIDHIESGRVLCSFNVPPRLLVCAFLFSFLTSFEIMVYDLIF